MAAIGLNNARFLVFISVGDHLALFLFFQRFRLIIIIIKYQRLLIELVNFIANFYNFVSINKIYFNYFYFYVF